MSFIISTACVRLKMPGVAKNVLMQPAEIANDHGYAWPSIETLCMRTCWSRRAVIDAINWLEEMGAIRPERTSGRNTRYWITAVNFTGERVPEKEEVDRYASSTRAPTAPVHRLHPTGAPTARDPCANRTLIPLNTVKGSS